jgi:hypothetical protein
MHTTNHLKSAEELAEATGADPQTVAKEYAAAVELAGLADDGDPNQSAE